MPRFVMDNPTTGQSEEVDLGFADMPRSWVESLADTGDVDAQAWLDEHPLPV